MSTSAQIRGKARSIAWICTLVYFGSYITRQNFGVMLLYVIGSFSSATGIPSDDMSVKLAVILTAMTIAYGIGQVVCGFIGDKISPVKMITAAMMGSIIVNIWVSFSSSIGVITVLWCINGVCQAMLWPPLTRFVSEQVGTEKYSDAVTYVGLSASTGTIFVYLFVKLSI